MKSSDRSILFGLVILGLAAAFWFMVLAPKRERAAELEDSVATLQAEVTAQEQLAAAAEQAQADYDRSYGQLVAFGKAAPETADTPSLLVQITDLADRAGVSFEGLSIAEGEATPQAPAAETTTDQNLDAGATTASSAEGAAAPATEAAAAPLPSGSPVGPAGLEVQEYEMRFSGNFFEVADLLASMDASVRAAKGHLRVDGRLLTIDGFQMQVDEESGGLAVELTASSYVLPGDEGLTAGATPAAPPAAGSVPASSTTPSTTPAPTP